MPCRDALAALVEGESSLMVLTLSEGKLELHHRIALPDIVLPTSLASDGQDSLWAAGGCIDQLPFQSSLVQSPILTSVRLLVLAASSCVKKTE